MIPVDTVLKVIAVIDEEDKIANNGSTQKLRWRVRLFLMNFKGSCLSNSKTMRFSEFYIINPVLVDYSL